MGDKDGAGWYPKAPREKKRVFSAEEKWPCQENTPWQMCYKNTCEQHRNGKEEAGYWPQPITKDEDGAREINTPCLQTGMKGESWKTCIKDLCIAHRRYKEWNKEFPHIITGEQARELFPGCDFIRDCSNIPWQMCYEKPCMRHRHFKKAAGY